MSTISSNRELQLRIACHQLEGLVQSGHAWTLKELIDTFPFIKGDLEAQVELVYQEYCFHEEMGSTPDPTLWYQRYPELAPRLKRLFGLHDLLADDATEVPDSFNPLETSPSTNSLTKHAPPPAEQTTYHFLQKTYEFERILGEGVSSIVYLATHRRLCRKFAIKLLRNPNPSQDEKNRFYAEAAAFNKLEHPNIIRIFDIDRLDEHDFIVMDYIGNGTLRDIIQRGCSLEFATQLLIRLADAVDAIHNAGILHRDLKPENILIDHADNPKIADFGLAKQAASLEQFKAMTGSCILVGTPAYMAPEQASGFGEQIGPTVDIFSLGIILYELMTGVRPFDSASTLDMLHAIHNKQPVNPSQLNHAIPRELELICLKCLEKSPDDRYQSAHDLLNDLQRFTQQRPVLARPVPLWQRQLRQITSAPVRSILIASLVTLVLFFLVQYARQTDRLQRARQRFEEEEQLLGGERSRADNAEKAYRQSLLNTRELIKRWSMLGEQFYARPDLTTTGTKELEAAVAYYDQIIAQNTVDDEILYDAAKANLRLGVLESQFGKWDQGIQRFQRANELILPIADGTNEKLLLAESYVQSGKIYDLLGEFPTAIEQFQAAHDRLSPLYSHNPGNLDIANPLATSVAFLASTQGKQGRLAESKKLFSYAHVILQSAFIDRVGFPRKNTPTRPSRGSFPNLYFFAKDQIALSEEFYNYLTRLGDNPAEHPDQAEYLESTALVLSGLAATMESSQGESLCEQALELALRFRELNARSDKRNPRWARLVAESQHQLAVQKCRFARLEQALPLFETAHQSLQKLRQFADTRVDYMLLHSHMLAEFAQVSRELGSNEQSLRAAENAIKVQTDLVEKFPDTAFLVKQLVKSLDAIALIHYGLEKDDLSIEYLQQAIKADPSNAAVLNNLAWISAHNQLGDPNENLVLAQKAFAIRPDSRILNTVAFAQCRLANYEEALETQQRCFELAPSPRSSDYLVLALIQAHRHEPNAAIEALQEAQRLRLEQNQCKASQLRIERDIQLEVENCLNLKLDPITPKPPSPAATNSPPPKP